MTTTAATLPDRAPGRHQRLAVRRVERQFATAPQVLHADLRDVRDLQVDGDVWRLTCGAGSLLGPQLLHTATRLELAVAAVKGADRALRRLARRGTTGPLRVVYAGGRLRVTES